MAQGLNYDRRKRLVTRFSTPAPKAPVYAMGGARGGMTVSPQGSISKFIESQGEAIVRDTAESVGQVSNEYVNQTPIGMLAKPFLGTNILSRAVGSVNAGAGESMRGEVTPMDLVNVASLAPIPVGAVVRGGLLAGRAGTKFLPSALKGIKALDASSDIKKQATAMQAGPIASVIERGIGSAFIEATPDAILSSPAVIDISKSDLPLEKKIALIGGIVGLVAAPGTAASVFERGKLKVSQGNIAKGQGTLTDEVRVATYNTPYSASDRALSSETSMPAAAIAGSTFGGREAYQTKWDISLYETDPEFRRIYDDVVSGKTTWEDSQNAFNKWKAKRKQQGLLNPSTVPQTFQELEKYAKTGTLSPTQRGPRTSPTLPNKPQRFTEALEGDATMIVYDSREKKLYDMLVARGELIPGGQTTGARGTNNREVQLERKELNEWFIKTFGITDPQRLQAVRERMYQALEGIV